MLSKLSRSQRQAIKYVTQYARTRKSAARKSLMEVLQLSNISWSTFENACTKIFSNARVALHFHPDRLTADMKTVAQSLLEQGIYKSQFETHISNGSVSAYSGGARDLWEKTLFGGAYQLDGVTDAQRPKYGALDVMLSPDGPAPRFGSCYFLLSPNVSTRCTYTYLDSHQDPVEKGTYEEFEDILAAIFKDTFFRNEAIGEKDLTPQKLIDHLLMNLEQPLKDPSNRKPSRNLNDYIESQVHGDITLKEDVDILVADPSFKGSFTGEILEQMCMKYSIKLYWHMGFVMKVDEIPSDFRGPTMPFLAKRIAQHGYVDANVIGAAAVDLKRNPELWKDRGSYEEVLQELKYMWHILVRYGNRQANKPI
ncbi:DUF3626 domain-containing protein [Paenibacillus agilis]|uniref:DUF3626 domain-containing protein n=1 Tax=Paenibacillus agilis TaxID=3020863 RepID=A0A559J2N1_9BACL|nr:DUF3626 domain-containing protein [Paenibacillus agilis]TVX94112.1 DUF3626 domain-containing protein [Paenibacillus agilis]